jgi:hypothetical protein
MKRILKWLGKNKLIAILLAIITYLSIVTFHDEITTLAIKMRNAIGRESYNTYLGYLFLILLLIASIYFAWLIMKSDRKWIKLALYAGITCLMVFSFRYLMTYNIEAIHFVEYAIVALLLLPVLRSYGETVFWVTILGLIDELFQYFFLVPTFKYFDFNDNVLNLLGAGTGAVLVFSLNPGAVEIKKYRWYRSPAILTGLVILLLFILLFSTGKITVDPLGEDGTNWFSLNRGTMPENPWKEAYAGRMFYILPAWQGVGLMYLLFAGFFGMDKISGYFLKYLKVYPSITKNFRKRNPG